MHVSAQIISSSEDQLLKLFQASAFAGKILHLPVTKPKAARPPILALLKALSMKWHLIAQP